MNARQNGIVAALGMLAACGASKPAMIDNGAVAQLTDQQMRPIDEARTEEARAKDHVARAAQGKIDATSNLTVGKADEDVAEAQLSKAKTDLETAQAQKADLATLESAKDAVARAQDRVKAAELHVAYLKDIVKSAAREQDDAEAHLATAQATTEKAKFDALSAAGSTEVQSKKASDYDEAVARAFSEEANTKKKLADANVDSVTDFNKWQEMDKKVKAQDAAAAASAPPPVAPVAPSLTPGK